MFELKEDIYSARMKELPDLQHLPGKSPADVSLRNDKKFKVLVTHALHGLSYILTCF